ncbi:redoxin domain-containing protein [Acidaminobacter sp. JC074]|nr:redoxin domain-containing protein [Acidaminobacter sp. JC074]
MELGGYQEIINEIHRRGGQLIAISPEKPNDSLSLHEKMALDFEILSDIDNRLAKKLGIAFSMGEELKKVYHSFGIDLKSKHGNDEYVMPVPATFVIDKEGMIQLAHIGVDYTQRLEPEEVLKYL